MATIYDGVFRTILNDCRKLIIPVINEIFGETYTGKEEIRFYPNEHFLDQQDEADKERITDTNFTVFGKIPKKYHIECESSLPDGKITIRLFEYESYACGRVSAESYRQKADSIKEQTIQLSAEADAQGEELEQLREEYRRAEEDMKQIIRYSHLEMLTQEVVDIFIKKIHVYKDKRVEIMWNFRENGKETE